MSKVVIVGAGPIGLYLAYKLKRKGITATIFDPRAGVYVRPGHVNREDMRKVLDEINENMPLTKRVHIKDIERVLYNKIEQLHIPVEKKSFIRLSTEGKGIIVANDEKVEEFIECDFVFDCSGSKRTVVNAVNSEISPAPFTIKPIVSEVNVKNNFLAYVTMSESQQRVIDLFENKANTFRPDREEPLAYARIIEQLRALGWKEFGYPKYYSVSFGHEKVCIYMEAPDNLPRELQNTWVETVLRTMSGVDSISFQQLPSFRKPRFNQFQVYPQEVREVAFEQKGKPTVLPFGDAQMEPHHRLALGLKSGMRRVDIFIEHIEEYKKHIAYFDAQEYFGLIKKSLEDHRNQVVELFADRAEYHGNWLEQAEKHYSEAIQKAKKQQQPTINFEKTLVEIRARIKYKEAQKLLAELGSADEIIHHAKTTPEQVKFHLSTIYALLQQIKADLPESFVEEHAKLVQNFTFLANIWKELGNHYFKKLLFKSAKSMYEEGVAIFATGTHQETNALQELTLYSNLIISKRKLGENTDIIALGKKALSKYTLTSDIMVISRKILANLFICAEELQQEQTLTNEALRMQVLEFSELYPELIDESMEKNLTDSGNTANYLKEFGMFKHKAGAPMSLKKEVSFAPGKSI
ncbi:FAD-dependent oxidoreductase [Legionella saoudiensis]|uniref:FAD-dependent oxidoreductase n=1 Tax=Legionella saoudiensis TaxID=1750561 RepID=UPI000730E6D1|nr:NAD(P)-binding protein [Legionella saoudiensis]